MNTIKQIGAACCACRACAQVCPKQAIRFQNDAYGFEFPAINDDLCIRCGRCLSVCPVSNRCTFQPATSVSVCGAARSACTQQREQGSSGGLFGALARQMIRQGGIVFAAAFDADLHLKTACAETEEQLRPLYKSKYLLCDTTDGFIAIRKQLQEGKKVLYCSTPCQIAALKLFLKRDYEGLLTVDFVCHGVGNQQMFNDSVKQYGQRMDSKVTDFTFRYKPARIVSAHHFEAAFANGKRRNGLYFDFPYYNAFCKELAFRDSCYLCAFACRDRVSDITVGDFFTVEQYLPQVRRTDGISMFLCNTEKGAAYFSQVRSQLDLWPLPAEILYRSNRFDATFANIPSRAQTFRETYRNNGFGKKTDAILNPHSDLIKKVYYKMPSLIRKTFRKLVG